MKISNTIKNIILLLAISEQAHGKHSNYNRRALRGDIKLATDTFEKQVADALGGNYEEEGCKGDGKPCEHANECCNDFCVPNNDGVSTTCAAGDTCTCA